MDIYLYESINCERSYKYSNYVKIYNIYPTKRYQYKKSSILIERMDFYLNPKEKYTSFIEFKITDNRLLDILSANKELSLFLNRFIVDWSSGKYIRNKYQAKIYHIDYDIVIFKILHISSEELDTYPKAIKRELVLKEFFG